MLPLILAAVGGYLVYDSFKPVKIMANGSLLAPNLQPSNLTPEQYKLVRTPDIRYKQGGRVWNDGDLLKRYKRGESIGFSAISHLKSKGLIKRADGTKRKSMMAGGDITFEDKVDAVKKSLLKRKKVSPKVQKDYGKTYSPKEAEDSAKRIVGSQMKYEIKS